MDYTEFKRSDHITDHQLCKALDAVCGHFEDQHLSDVDKTVISAVKYIRKAMSDEELVMVYYP
mgnify:CR=1 FL=1|tara:strand:+ start:708 stop:896 length:189 start_codon:yes stop_codon:yes gene_type:complete